MNTLTWIDAITLVLRDAGEPLDYNQIAQAITDQDLRDVSNTLNPAVSVNATISQYIRNQGDRCQIVRVSRGLIGLREWVSPTSEPGVHPVASYSIRRPQEPELAKGSLDDDGQLETGLISAYGMFWRRDNVMWKREPKLLGAKQLGAKTVDFSNQVGIYMLYDSSRPIYVGQVSAPRLGRRLFEHTRDRLNGRWQRFSWFGLRGVSESGALEEVDSSGFSTSSVIDALEAVLIEGVEPVQNRRAGNSFGTEYLQSEDPEIQSERQRALAMHLLSTTGAGEI